MSWIAAYWKRGELLYESGFETSWEAVEFLNTSTQIGTYTADHVHDETSGLWYTAPVQGGDRGVWAQLGRKPTDPEPYSDARELARQLAVSGYDFDAAVKLVNKVVRIGRTIPINVKD